MTLNKQEKRYAIITGIIVAVAVLYWLVWQPYAQEYDDLQTQSNNYAQQIAEGRAMLQRQMNLGPVWAAMRNNGLRSDASLAESQFYAAILTWSRNAGTTDPSFKTDPIKPDREAAENHFQTVNFHVTVVGTLSQISTLLWSVETAAIPVRILDCQIAPKKEGLDNQSSPLTAQITIATLCMLPEANTAPDEVSMAGNAASAPQPQESQQ